jgi:prepilin-type N-terminal cleavage/methylation domain-containing protein/prepilin-type processing-associated H-X9-DG protein
MWPRRQRGFTLIELLVVIGVLLVLAGILLPVLASARAKARETDCRTKLHQITLALRMYADDNNSGLPLPPGWDLQLARYIQTRPPYSCPDVKYWDWNPRIPWKPGDWTRGYSYNGFLAGVPPTLAQSNQPSRPLQMDKVHFPVATVVFHEADSRVIVSTGPDYPAPYGLQAEAGGVRHRGGSNYAFLDGHVKWYRPEQVLGGVHAPPPDGSKPTFRPN